LFEDTPFDGIKKGLPTSGEAGNPDRFKTINEL